MATLVQDLREFADFIEAQPELLDDNRQTVYAVFTGSPQETGEKLKALLASGKVVRKKEWGSDKQGLEFSVHFGQVKVEVNVSKETLGCQKVKVIREVEEWQCPESFVQELANRSEVEVPDGS